MNTAGVMRPTMRRRLLDWLLPPTRHGLMVMSREGFEEVLHTNTDIHLGVNDRLRVLLTGRLHLQVVAHLEHKPGNVESESSVSTA